MTDMQYATGCIAVHPTGFMGWNLWVKQNYTFTLWGVSNDTTPLSKVSRDKPQSSTEGGHTTVTVHRFSRTCSPAPPRASRSEPSSGLRPCRSHLEKDDKWWLLQTLSRQPITGLHPSAADSQSQSSRLCFKQEVTVFQQVLPGTTALQQWNQRCHMLI